MIIGLVTEYFTSHSFIPTRELASACKFGTAVNIIQGLALGYKSRLDLWACGPFLEACGAEIRVLPGLRWYKTSSIISSSTTATTPTATTALLHDRTNAAATPTTPFYSYCINYSCCRLPAVCCCCCCRQQSDSASGCLVVICCSAISNSSYNSPGCIIPVFVLSSAIFVSFQLCDLYGIALAALGMCHGQRWKREVGCWMICTKSQFD